MHTSCSEKPESEPTCETRLPRSPGLALWSRWPLQAVTMPHIVSHASPSQCKALIICHVNIHSAVECPESEPTCETRLPRSPGLACGAAGPCKQSPCLTLCHMPPSLCRALIAPMHAYIKVKSQSLNSPVRPVCPEAPVWLLWSRWPLQAVTMSHIVSHASPSQCKALISLHHVNIHHSGISQSLNPPVRPVCPEAPVWPVEPLAPASSHHPSHCVTCLPLLCTKL